LTAWLLTRRVGGDWGELDEHDWREIESRLRTASGFSRLTPSQRAPGYQLSRRPTAASQIATAVGMLMANRHAALFHTGIDWSRFPPIWQDAL